MSAFGKIKAGLEEGVRHARCMRQHGEAHVRTQVAGARPGTLAGECLACGHTWIERPSSDKAGGANAG